MLFVVGSHGRRNPPVLQTRQKDEADCYARCLMQTQGEPRIAIEPEPVAEHYASREDQFRAGKFGMWLFLLTELVMFGGLFCLYFVFRANRPKPSPGGRTSLIRTLAQPTPPCC